MPRTNIKNAVEPITEVSGIALTLDERTARAVKVLTGLGTIHFTPRADELARGDGFDDIRQVVSTVQGAGGRMGVTSLINDGLRGREVTA